MTMRPDRGAVLVMRASAVRQAYDRVFTRRDKQAR